MGLCSSLLDPCSVGFVVFLRSFVRPGSVALVYGLANTELPLLILDYVTMESSPSLQAFAQSRPALLLFGMTKPGSFMFVADSISSGSPTLLQSSVQLDSTMSAYGMT